MRKFYNLSLSLYLLVSIYFYLVSQSLLGMNGVTINISVRSSSTTGSRVFLWFLRGETDLVQKAALISPGTSRRGVEKGAHAARVTLRRRGDDAGSRVRYSRRSRCHRRRWWSSTTRWRHVESSHAWWRTASWSVELVQQRLDGGLIELRRGGLLLLRRRRRGWELHASLWRLGVHWRSLLLVHWRRWWMLVLHLLRLRRRRRRLVLRLLLRRLNRKLNRNFEHLVFVRLFFWRLGGRIRNFFSVFINRRLLSRNDSCDSV